METFTKLFGTLLVFVYHCFDRVVIHGYLSGLSRPGQVVHFFRDVVGEAVTDKAVLSRRTNEYQAMSTTRTTRVRHQVLPRSPSQTRRRPGRTAEAKGRLPGLLRRSCGRCQHPRTGARLARPNRAADRQHWSDHTVRARKRCAQTLTKAEFMAEAGQTESYFSLDHGGVHFVVLDACYRKDGISYDAGKFDWKDTDIPAVEREWLS